MHILYVTNPSEESAKKLAKILIEKKLIACANIHESNSIYPWEGYLKDEKEWILLGKTSENPDKVQKEIESLHEYDCPCVLTIDANSNPQYEEWVDSVLR